jgi:uncharacterized protein (DUF983 family)
MDEKVQNGQRKVQNAQNGKIQTLFVNHLSPPKSGHLCPKCSEGVLDYDGMLNLSCMKCGYTLTGCFS